MLPARSIPVRAEARQEIHETARVSRPETGVASFYARGLVAHASGGRCPPSVRARRPDRRVGPNAAQPDDWHGSCSAPQRGGPMSVERLALEAIQERCRRGDDGSDCFRDGDAYRRAAVGHPFPTAGRAISRYTLVRWATRSRQAMRCASAARAGRTFVVRTADPCAPMMRHDFCTWRGGLRASLGSCRVDIEITLDEAPDGANGVGAWVTGKNTISLLAEVLRRFEASALRPREFSIRTINDEVDDWFWLQQTPPIP
jgi:hypothetical protein